MSDNDANICTLKNTIAQVISFAILIPAPLKPLSPKTERLPRSLALHTRCADHGGCIHARSTRRRRKLYVLGTRPGASRTASPHVERTAVMACGGEASGRGRILMLNFYFNSDFRRYSVCKILWIYISITTNFFG